MTSSVATLDASAIGTNLRALQAAAGGVPVCAVVKADGYGHGALGVARAALDAGAAMLAVARVHEAESLRAGGVDAPILLLSEPAPDELAAVADLGTAVVAYRGETIDALADLAARRGTTLPIHLKVDTGMRRVGCDPSDAVALAERIVTAPGTALAGTMTHLAVADDPASATTARQLDRFDEVLAAMAAAGVAPGLVHAANSAGAIAHPRARRDMVRLGIALYGIAPDPGLDPVRYPVLSSLVPALTWSSRVSFVKSATAGDAVSYGHRHVVTADTVLATVPVGYADGVRRDLGLRGGTVLVGGVARPIVGVVTMDQFVVDCGPDADVAIGDEVVLLGAQGGARCTPEDWAAHLDTIGYEVVCAIGARVERRIR